MTGEARIARGALIWSAALSIPAIAIAASVSGAEAAWSIAAAAGVIALNLVLTVVFDRIAARFDARTRVILSLPSLVLRMIVALTALTILRVQPFIDAPVFVGAFSATLLLVLVLQSRDWKRTPWLALAFTPAEKETV